MIEVVAYAPQAGTFPHVPDYLVVRDGGVLLKAEQGKSPESEIALTPLLAKGEAQRLEPAQPWKAASWFVLDHQPVWISNSDMEGWRSKRANEILAESTSIGDPEVRIARLKTAARVAGVPLAQLWTKLEAARKYPNEPLDEVYRRVKNTK